MTGSSLVDALIVASLIIAWLFVYKFGTSTHGRRLGRAESVGKLADPRRKPFAQMG